MVCVLGGWGMCVLGAVKEEVCRPLLKVSYKDSKLFNEDLIPPA